MFESFRKSEATCLTVLPYNPLLIGQKLLENDKNSNATFRVIFKYCVQSALAWHWGENIMRNSGCFSKAFLATGLTTSSTGFGSIT